MRETPKQGTGEQSDDEAEPNLSPESNAAAIRKKNPLVFNESFVRIQSKEKLENGVEKVVERVGSRVIMEQEWGELLEGRAAILALRERAQMEQQGDDNFHEESVGRELSEEQWQEWQCSQATIAELCRLCGPTEELIVAKEQVSTFQGCMMDILQDCIAELEKYELDVALLQMTLRDLEAKNNCQLWRN